MKQKMSLPVFFVVAVCLCLSVMHTDISYVSAAETDAYISGQQRSESNSVRLYDEAMRPYITKSVNRDGEQVVTYADTYAGAFLDDEGLLNIGIIGLRKTGFGYGGQVKYLCQTYSYNYLRKIQGSLAVVMSGYTIFCLAINDAFNCVEISLNNGSSVEQIVAYLQNQDLYCENALSFLICPDGKNEETANTAFCGDKLWRTGGFDASNPIQGASICVNAVDNETGAKGFITCEHAALTNQSNPDLFHQSSSGPFMGKGLKGQKGGTVDAAFVPFANQNDWSLTPYARLGTTTYRNIKLGNNIDIRIGMEVIRIGQTTGIVDDKITAIDADVTTDVKITNCFKFAKTPVKGDSGGPVFWPDGDTLYLIGMVFANTTTGGGYACSMLNIIGALDVTPITNDSMPGTWRTVGGIATYDFLWPGSNYGLTSSFSVPAGLTVNSGSLFRIRSLDGNAFGIITQCPNSPAAFSVSAASSAPNSDPDYYYFGDDLFHIESGVLFLPSAALSSYWSWGGQGGYLTIWTECNNGTVNLYMDFTFTGWWLAFAGTDNLVLEVLC